LNSERNERRANRRRVLSGVTSKEAPESRIHDKIPEEDGGLSIED
jgi:hypothetical protein